MAPAFGQWRPAPLNRLPTISLQTLSTTPDPPCVRLAFDRLHPILPVALLRHRGFHGVNRKVERDCDRELYKLRNEVERLSRRLKDRRRIYMRFDKLDAMLLGFLNLALVVEMMHDLAQKGPKSHSHCPFSSFKRGSRTKNAFQQSGSDQSSNTAHHSSLVAAAFAIDQHERHVFELVFTR